MTIAVRVVGEMLDLPGIESCEIVYLDMVPVREVFSHVWECDRTLLQSLVVARLKGYFAVADLKATALEATKTFELFDWENADSADLFSDYYDCVR